MAIDLTDQTGPIKDDESVVDRLLEKTLGPLTELSNNSEFEKALIVERTLEGLARAKAQGKQLGRPPGSKDRKKRSRRGYYARWAE